MKSVGIDLGCFSLKIAQIYVRGRSFKVKQLSEVELSSKASDWNLSVLEVLRKLNLPKDTKVIVGLSEDKIIHHRLSLPFKKKFDILKTLPFELEDDLPLPSSQCIFEANPLYENDQNQTEVFTSICSKESVKNILSLFHEAGMEPDVVASEGFCLNPIFRSALSIKPCSSPNHLSGFLHLGHKKSFLSLYEQNYLLDIRYIPWGGDLVLKGVMKGYRVSYDEALVGVKEKSFVASEGMKLNESQKHHAHMIQEVFEKLINQLKFQILEIENKYEKKIEHLFLSGGPSCTKNLPNYFSRRLKLKAYELKTSKVYGESPLRGCVALGLALAATQKSSQDINNFRKEKFAKKGIFWSSLWENYNSLIKSTAVFLLLFLVFSMIRDGVSLHSLERSDDIMKQHAAKITGFKGRSLSEKNINKYVKKKEKEKRNQDILKKFLHSPSPLEIFDKMSSSWSFDKEAKFEIYELKILKGRVTLKGSIASKYLSQLERKIKAIALKGKILKRPLKNQESFSYDFGVSL